MKNSIKYVLSVLFIITLMILYWVFIHKHKINIDLFPQNFVVVLYDGGKVKKKCEINNASKEYKTLYNFVDNNKGGWSLDYQMRMPSVSFMSPSLNIELREKRIQISFLEQGSKGKTHVYRELDTSLILTEVCGIKL